MVGIGRAHRPDALTQRLTPTSQVRRYPILKNVAKLRNNVMALSLPKLSNTVGFDGFSRCPLLPFWTKTGRNQPAAHDKRYLPSETGWLHGIIRPPPGCGVVELDWDGQEIAIMAGLSGDPTMIADYNSGDPHIAFGRRAGLVPPDATKETHGEFRNKVLKPIVLGQNYGMGPFGIQAKTKKSCCGRVKHMPRTGLFIPCFTTGVMT